MTYAELKYWGNPPYPVSLEDRYGFPEAILYPDGTFVPVGTSNVGKVVKDGPNELEVVWDGAMVAPWGHTKGQILGILV